MRNDWKQSGLDKRDFQHTHNGPDVPKQGGSKRKKNTKKWCKGVVGREHVGKIQYDNYIREGDKCGLLQWMPSWWMCHHKEVCIQCRKVLRHLKREECPDNKP